MNLDIMNKIRTKMKDVLCTEHMQKLEEAFTEIQEDLNQNGLREKKNLVKQFISAKKVEGCSKRTEEYYLSTLTFFEKHIKNDICSVTTSAIREYLINYQKINNCSNVTLDTVRRILSTFYKWLEEEDYIIKSPMKRIHKIKTPVMLKSALSDEQIELIRKAANDNKRNLAIIDMFLSSGIKIRPCLLLRENEAINRALCKTLS